MPDLPLLARARHELHAWASPLVNPFVAQSRRVEARGVRWLLTLLFIVAIWGAAMTLLYFWAQDERVERNFADDGARGWIIVVWSVSWIMARLRDSELLRQEVIKGRFEPIQLMPLSATRRAWLWSAPNSQWGLLLSATMLPAIAWGLGGGLLAFREALLLIFLVTISQWSVPIWSPLAWRMQTVKPDAKQAALQGLGGGKAAKLGDGFVLPPDLAVSARGWGGGLGLMAPFWLAIQFGARGILSAIVVGYWSGLPSYVRAASDEIWFNWPIFLVRWLGEAQPFFGFALPPILLLLPILLANAIIRVLRLAAVTGREPFWTGARFALWQRAQTVSSALIFVFALGVLWPGAIEGAWLANWFRVLGGTTTQALAAWWIAMVAAGALATTAMWRTALELPVGALSLRAQMPRAAKLAARGLVVALIFWAGACLLGWRWPLGALWLQVVPASIAAAAVWIGAQGAIWMGHRAPRWARGFAVWHALWFYGAPIGGALLLVLAQFPVELLINFYPLSPWTLWLMLRDPAVAGNSIFWTACGGHLALALATGALAWRLGRDRIRVPAQPGAPDNEKLLDELTPQGQPENAPAVPQMMATISLSRKPLQAPDAWTLRILNALGRFDNPLWILEMRRALSSVAPRTFAIWMLALQAVVVSVPVVILPMILIATGYWASDAFAIFVGLMLSIWCIATLTAESGASLCYDRDRLDGTLELLFLTPRSPAEIAAGKVGPFAVRTALMALLFAPIYLVGVGCLPTIGEPLLAVAYLVAPLLIAMLAARGVVGAHWMALKKSKIGVSNVSFALSLVIAFALLCEAFALIYAFTLGAIYVVAAVLLLAAIYAIESLWLWRRGLVELQRWRVGGVPGAK